MKRKPFIFCIFTICLLALAACGQETSGIEHVQRVISGEGDVYSPARCNDVIIYKADEGETPETVIAEMKKAILEPLTVDMSDRPFTVTAYDVDEQSEIYKLTPTQEFPEGLFVPQWIREYEWSAVADEAWLLPTLEGYYSFEGTDLVSMDVLLQEGDSKDGMVPFVAQGSEEAFQFILMRQGDVYCLLRAEEMESFHVGDFLNNGRKQLVYHPVTGTGTGVLVEELHVVDLETLEEYAVSDFVKEAESMVDIEALVNTEDVVGTGNEVEPEKIFIGAYQYYQVEGNQIYVNLNVSVQTWEELGTIRGVLEEKDGEIIVGEWQYTDAELETCVNRCKGVVEGYLNGIASEDELPDSQLFYSENLFEYIKKKAEVVRALREKQDVSMNAEKISFEVIETKKLDNAYYVQLQLGIEGAFSSCYLLVAEDNDTFKVADIYFDMKDGIDGYTTGLLNSDREIDNLEIWNDATWVEGVMNRLAEYEAGVLAEEPTIGVPMYLY